jgi:hypothetical protein
MQANMNGDFSINSLAPPKSSTQPFSLGNVVDQTLLFYGLKQITKQMNGSPYDYSLEPYTNGIQFNIGSYSQTL